MKKQVVEGLVALLVGVVLGWVFLRSPQIPLDVPLWPLASVGGMLLALAVVLWVQFGRRPSRDISVTVKMRNNAGVYILASAFVLGVAVFCVSVSGPRAVPAWVFANRVPYNEALTRVDMVKLESKDISGIRGLADALRDAEPFHPVGVSGREGRAILDVLGGEETDVLRARIRDIVYAYSVELEGEYYNICVVFKEERDDAMVTGTYWVVAIKFH